MGERGTPLLRISLAWAALACCSAAFGADAGTAAGGISQSSRLKKRLATTDITRVQPPGPTQAQITVPADVVRNFTITDKSGAVLAAEAMPDGSERLQGAARAEIALVPKTAPPAAAKLERERVTLPVVYLHFKDPSGQWGDQPVEGGVFLEAARSPMVWDAASGAYATEVFVGYDYSDGRNIALPERRSVLLLAQGGGTTVAPDTVTIAQSGAGGASRVAVRTKVREGAVTIVARETPQNELPVSIPVEAELGDLGVEVNPSEPDAFGLGTGSIVVRLLALDGREMPSSLRTTPVVLSINAPFLTTATSVTLPANTTNLEVPFRTRGTGRGIVRVEAGGLRKDAPFHSRWPVASLVAVLLGGLVGAVVRWFHRHESKKRLARSLVKGTVVGVVVVAAVWAGLVRLEIGSVATTPLGGFIIAALAAVLGTALVDRIATGVFKLGKEPSDG